MTHYQKGVMGEKYVKAATGIEAHTENRGISRHDFYNANKYIIYVRLHIKVSKSVKAAGYFIRYFPWW